MISLAETPRRVTVSPEFGPYGNKRERQAHLFGRNGSSIYRGPLLLAMADNVYGPFA